MANITGVTVTIYGVAFDECVTCKKKHLRESRQTRHVRDPIVTLTYDLVSLPVIGQNLPRAGLVTDWEFHGNFKFQVVCRCLFTFEGWEFSFASLSVIKLLDAVH